MAGTPVRTYYTTLQGLLQQFAAAMGTDITTLPKAMRVAVYGCLALVAVLVRVLVDKGVITNADLAGGVAAAQAEITAGSWPDEPI